MSDEKQLTETINRHEDGSVEMIYRSSDGTVLVGYADSIDVAQQKDDLWNDVVQEGMERNRFSSQHNTTSEKIQTGAHPELLTLYVSRFGAYDLDVNVQERYADEIQRGLATFIGEQ